MNKYTVVTTLKVRTPSGVREKKSGDVISLSEDMAIRLIEGGKIKPFCPDCFSPDGVLEEAFMEARADGWTDEQFCGYIDALREAGALMAPWGFKVKDSPLASEFWIISDTTALGKLPAGAKGFTLDELRPVVEAALVFEGAEVVEVRF